MKTLVLNVYCAVKELINVTLETVRYTAITASTRHRMT
jgi:hypothetical protein